MLKNPIKMIGAGVLSLLSLDIHGMTIEQAKKTCTELGFVEVNEAFGSCVLRLYKTEQPTTESAAKRMEEREARLRSEARDAMYLRQLDENRKALENAQRRQNGLKMMEYGLGLMAGPQRQNSNGPVTCFSQPNGVGGAIVNCQ